MNLVREKASFIGLNWSIGIVIALSAGPIFLINDSPLMKGYVSGEYTGEPDSNLIFSSKLLGFPLSKLYELVPQFSWYTWMLLITTLLCITATLLSTRTLKELVSWTIFLTPLTAYAALRPDYTFTALVGVSLAVASYLMFRRSESSKSNVFGAALSSILIVIAVSWRPEAGILAYAVLAPAFIVVSLVNRRVWSTLWLLVAGLMGYIFSIFLATINTSRWTDWLEYNSLRGLLHSDRLQIASSYGPSAGWTESQITAFATFIYPDEPTFMLPGLQALDETLPAVTSMPAETLLEIAQVGLFDVLSFWPIWLLGLSIFLIPRDFRVWSYRNVSLLLASCIAYWSLLTLVIRYVRLPGHLHLPLVIAMVICLAVCFTDWKSPHSQSTPFTLATKSWAVSLAIFAILAALFLSPFKLIDNYQKGEELNDQSNQFLESLNSVTGCKSFLATPIIAGAAMSHPYGSNPYWSAPILELGWGTMSPAWVDRRNELGFGLNVLGSLRSRGADIFMPGFCFIGDQGQASVYQSLLSDYGYGRFTPIPISTIMSFNDPITIWRFNESA